MAAPSTAPAPASRPRPPSAADLASFGAHPLRWRAAWPVLVSWTLGGILVAAASYGLLAADPYRGIAPELAAASRGQDVLTLAAIPVLVWAGHRSRAGSLRGHLLWLGVLGYVAYAYATYLIGVAHNDAFLLYSAAVGLSTAALLDGLLRIEVVAAAPAFTGLGRRGVGWFLVVTGATFALLWLADIVPAIPATGCHGRLAPTT